MIRNVKHEKIKAEKGKHLRILRFRQLKGHRMEKGKDAKKSTWPLHNDKRRKEGRNTMDDEDFASLDERSPTSRDAQISVALLKQTATLMEKESRDCCTRERERERIM